MPQKYLDVYNAAILDSKNSRQLDSLDKFESLILNSHIVYNEKQFSVVDVRYQSVIRPLGEFGRASKIYQKILHQFGRLDYVTAAYNFNQALLLKRFAGEGVESLLFGEININEYYEEILKALFNVLFIEGSYNYKANVINTVYQTGKGNDSLENSKIDDYLMRMIERKFSTSTLGEISSLNDYPLNMDDFIEGLIDNPNEVENVVKVFYGINSLQDIKYLKESLMPFKGGENVLGIIFDYVAIIENYSNQLNNILNENKELLAMNPGSEYITTTVSFLEYFSPFENVQKSKNTLTKLAGNSDKSSVSHHLGMIDSWSRPKMNKALASARSTCEYDLGFWSVTYECF